jgi:hypothetical protein
MWGVKPVNAASVRTASSSAVLRELTIQVESANALRSVTAFVAVSAGTREASGSIVQLRIREIATCVSDYDTAWLIACVCVDCRCRVDINGGTGVRRMRCEHHISIGSWLSVSLVVVASRRSTMD